MKSQLLKKQLVSKMATGGKVDPDDKGKKYATKEEAAKNATVVKSEGDVPAGAKKVVNSDGSVTFYVESKSEAPPIARPAGKNPSGSIVKKAMVTSIGKPTPKKTVPTKQPPVNQQQVEAFTIPAPVKQKVGPGSAVGYIGEVRQDFSSGPVGSVDLGNKKVPIQKYLLPGQYNTKTKKWDVEGAWGNPTSLYGYEGTNGDFVPIEMNYLNPNPSGVYLPNELPAWGDPNLAKQMVAEGAPTVTDGPTLNDIKAIGGDTSNVKEVNYQRNMYEGTLGKKMGVDRPVDEVKKDVVPASGLPIGGMKKGGLLGKYASGGPILNPQIDYSNYYNQLKNPNTTTQPKTQQLDQDVTTNSDPNNETGKGLLGKFNALGASQKSGFYSMAGNAVGAGIDMMDRKDGRSSIAGQALSGAAKGAAAGAILGPVGMAVGAVIGGTFGTIKGVGEKKERKNNAIEDVREGVNDMTNKPYDPTAPNSYTSTLYDKRDFRKGIMGLFADGGQVKGPGTGTSDGVKANVKEGSFVVPAKNADIAKKIRKHMLGKEEKAELNQKGGVPVKLSNGEHVFSPEEVRELTAAGIDLDKLAPESKSKLREEYKCGGKIPMGYADGGQVDPKKELAKMDADEKAAAEKRKKSLESKETYNEILKQYKDRITKRNKWKSEYDRVKVGVDMLQKDYADLLKYESDESKWAYGDNADRIKNQKKELLKKIDVLTGERDNAKKTYDYLNDDNNFDKTTGKSKMSLSKVSPVTNNIPAPKVTSVPVTNTKQTATSGVGNKSNGSSILNSLKYTAPPIVPGAGEDDVVVPGSNKTSGPSTNALPYDAQPDLDAQKQINEGLSTGQTPLAKSIDDAYKVPAANENGLGKRFGLGDAVGLGLGTLQAGFGLQQLLKDKRPVGKIDPDFDNQTNQALANSKYGYTPQQKSLLQDQIVQNRIDQQNSVNAMAGGNASVGLNNMRSAINNQVRNQLQMASEDERLRLQKQQYAAGLVGQRSGMRRQLFEDNLNKFMQNQQAGAALLGAGLQNIVGAQRYAQERAAQEQINKMMYQPVNITI